MKRAFQRVRGLSLLVVVFSFSLNAQVTLNPTFVTQNDTVEVIFDATQGNGALTGVNQVYAHTGVITNLSPTLSSWRHVQGTWGTADPKVQMTNLGNNLHSIKYHINSFYGVPSNETVTHLAFVFRDVSGGTVGRTSTGGDIFVPISQGGFQSLLQQPTGFDIYEDTDTISVEALTSANADLTLFLNSNVLVQYSDTNRLSYEIDLAAYPAGSYDIVFRAVYQGNVHYDTVSFLSRTSGSNIGFDTAGYEEGLTVLNDSTIALKLRAPFKEYAYVIGDFNNWQVQQEYEMFKNPDGLHFWQIITGLDPNTEYGFQYYVGEEAIIIGDPYTEKILDPWNDPWIPPTVYPNLKPYPTGKTTGRLSTFLINKPVYQWQNDATFERPDAQDLVVYELLIRDFDNLHTYNSVIERLGYLDSLGINAIELMPVMEFTGNDSWGYDPIFFMAPDKYYGRANDLKALIDSAHGRGIAIIMDIAMNHAFGDCPLVQLYFDPSAGTWGQPSAQSPWFNEVPKHDFNVGFDFNHESDATKYFVKRVFQHWVKEYHIDGYRVDLSKGFTQKNTLGNIAAMAQYDQGRINILQRIKNNVHEVDSQVYMILEHFADNDEEVELASRDFMLWRNENHEYNEATMGYSSNFSNIYYGNANFTSPALVGYMESHDEDRLMYRNLNYGASSGNYSTKDLFTALDRVEMAAALFFTVPGPKMLWQFGEMGYDYHINRCPDGTIDPGCRLAQKPIRWDYLEEQERRDLYLQFANLINLRKTAKKLFRTNNVTTRLYGTVKLLKLETSDSNAVIIGNFGLTPSQVIEAFPHSGWWYDFNTGDSMMVSSMLDSTFAPGEYHIWLDFKVQREYNNVSTSEWSVPGNSFSVYPNPIGSTSVLDLSNKVSGDLELSVWTVGGKLIEKQRLELSPDHGAYYSLEDLYQRLPPGIYYLNLENGTDKEVLKIVRP